MSSLNNFGVPLGTSGRAGILAPQPQHRFRITFDGLEGSDETDRQPVMRQQTRAVARTQEIYDQPLIVLTLADLPSGDVQQFVSDLKRPRQEVSLTVEAIDGGNDAALYSVTYGSVRVAAHSYTFDYATAHAVIHTVTLSFNSERVSLPEPKAA